MTIQDICNLIIIVGSAYLMIINIFKTFSKPTSKFNERRLNKAKKEIDAVLGELLPKYLEPIVEINETQNKKIGNIEVMVNKINTSSKDVLRQKIMAIYQANKRAQSLTIYDREALDELYLDYKEQDGNSYIDKYYKRMKGWKTIEE